MIDEARAPYNANKSEAFQISVEAMAEFYENPARAVNISLDDVGVKEQKSTHRRPLSAAQFVEHSETAPQSEAPPLNPPNRDPKHDVQNTIAHVQAPAGHYTLNGLGTVGVLRWILAFLLYHDGLRGTSVQFFVDGQSSLHHAILERWRWVSAKRLILDWFHLKTKCAKEWSSVIRNTVLRNQILNHLSDLLWIGQIDAASAYLSTLDQTQLKPGHSV